jgi:GNAT superfamily N-acetyltransferase
VNSARAIETEVREITSAQLSASCCDNRLASYYASTLGSAGRYLAAFHDVIMVGYAICGIDDGGLITLCLLHVKEEYRRLGIATRLLNEVESSCRSNGENRVKCCVSEYIDNFVFLREFFEKRGYVLADKLFVFWCDGHGNPGYVGWDRYMEKRGDSLLRWLEADGFSAAALEDAGEELLTSLRELGARNRELDVAALLDGRKGILSKRISCVTVKDGRVVAYCMANEPDSVSIVFEQIGVASEYINTGAILPAVSASIRRCKKFEYRRVLYSIYESNASALSFAKRVLSNVTSVTKVQYNYVKQIETSPKKVI